MESTGTGFSRRCNTSQFSMGTLATARRTGPSDFHREVSRLRSSRTSAGRKPGTRTGTGRTTRAEDAFVVALIENNAKEVGFCAYNLHGFDVELRQFSDFNSFSTTIATLCIFDPVEILLSLSSANGPLEGALQAYEFTRNIKLSYIARTYFNETQGGMAVERLSTDRCSNLANLGSSPYYLALASCGALLRYIEHTNNTLFMPGTLRIQFKPNEGTLFLDIATMEGLELLQNSRLQLGSLNGKSQLQAMDKTKTRAGARLLRRSLLEPPAELVTIMLRQDAVEEISNSEDLYFHIVAVLSRFPDLERALAGLLARENARMKKQNWANKNAKAPPRQTSTGPGLTSSHSASLSVDYTLVDDIRAPSIATIRSVIYIKYALDALDDVLKVLTGVKSSLLLAIARSMRIPELGKLQEAIDGVIVPDAEPSKDVEHMRLQGAFAVQTGRNEQLDVARKTLSENVEEMRSLTESLQTKYDFHKLSLAMSVKRGYHFTFPAKRICQKKLPEEFIQVQKGGNLHRFSTVALNSLNDRYMESLAEIWGHTDFELRSLLEVIFAKRTVIALYRLCDSVALLDLLASFVTYSSLSPVPNIRPRMTQGGPIAIRQAHHPILLAMNAANSVPNDVFIDETSGLHIITGQNQSGKSTLLKCVGLLSIIAQTGATVPAEFASLRIMHKILSRFNTSDDINQGQSHFSREMHDVAGILESIKDNMNNACEGLKARSATPIAHSWSQKHVFERKHKHALVLMDELCRATATTDGFAMAFAILERLIATPGVFTFFSTHLLGLAALEKVHPIVKVFHLATTRPAVHDGAAQPGSTIVEGDSSAQVEADTDKIADQITSRTQFTYRLTNGVLGTLNYGIDTARAAGFPKNVVKDAVATREKLPVRRIASPEDFGEAHLPPQAMANARKAKGTLGVVARVSMFRSTATDSESLRQQLQQFQNTVKSAREAHLRSGQAGGSSPSNVSR